MRVTTMPDISGVIIFLVYFNTRLISISTLEAAMQDRKSGEARQHSGRR